MSKSLGNFFTLRDLVDSNDNPSGRRWDPLAIRYCLLKVNYRSKLNFTFQELAAAEKGLLNLRSFVKRCLTHQGPDSNLDQINSLITKCRNDFISFMDDDLNITQALATLHTFISHVNRLESGLGRKSGKAVSEFLFELDQILGLKLQDPPSPYYTLNPEEQRLLEERTRARQNKDYKRADEIRELLLTKGIKLEDTPHGTRWTRI